MKKIIIFIFMFLIVGCSSNLDKDTYIKEMNIKADLLEKYNKDLYVSDSKVVNTALDNIKLTIDEMIKLDGPKDKKDQEDLLDEGFNQLYSSFDSLSNAYKDKDINLVNVYLKEVQKKSILVGNLALEYDKNLLIQP